MYGASQFYALGAKILISIDKTKFSVVFMVVFSIARL